MKEITTKKLVETIIEGIQNRKGQRIVSIDLRKVKEAPVEYMIVAEGTSNTQVSAIADEVDDFVRTTTHVHPLAVAGQENAEWIAMDYGTVFVHIMQRGPRAFYDIENLWSDGKITEIDASLFDDAHHLWTMVIWQQGRERSAKRPQLHQVPVVHPEQRD